MVPRQESLSLIAAGLIALASAVQGAAQPTGLVGCAGSGPPLQTCSDVSHATLFEFGCPRKWELYLGRVAFQPLRYVGPIDIEIDSRGVAGGQFGLPLYVECIRVQDHPPELGYCDGVGTVILQVMGHTECDGRERRGRIDLGFMLAPGDEYVIRLHFVSSEDLVAHSPFFRCIWVAPAGTPFPPRTAVQPALWGQVKQLYRVP